MNEPTDSEILDYAERLFEADLDHIEARTMWFRGFLKDSDYQERIAFLRMQAFKTAERELTPDPYSDEADYRRKEQQEEQAADEHEELGVGA